MKKRIIALSVAAVLLVLACIGGTYAYLKDVDGAKNVMTVGNISITQNEEQRAYDANGNYTGVLEAFEDGKRIRPAVYYNEDGSVATSRPADWAKDKYVTANGSDEYLIADKVIENQIDKIVSVTNNSNEDIYARTIFLWQDEVIDGKHTADRIASVWTENNSGEQDTGHYNWLKDDQGNYVVVTIDGVNYIATVHYYADVIEAGETSLSSLKSFWVPGTKYTTTDMAAQYNVLALSQAVQSAGFHDDHVALDTAFGEINGENLAEWFADIQ